MNKTFKKLLVISSAAFLLAGCGKSSSSSADTSSSSGSDTTVTPEAEKYKISVTVSSGVEYELSTDYAKAGETVTLTIKSVGAGISIKSVVLNGNKELEGNADHTVYTFTMPDQSARLVISLSISGDVVIEGDVVAALQLDEATGVYCAKGVKANGSGSTSKINYVISSDGGKTTLGCLDLDETKTFGNVEICYSSGYALEIANGYTYDFYYDPNATECPCYIQRSGVDVLPSDVSSLSDLLITGRTVRSEYAVYPDNLVGAHFKVMDKTTDDVITKEMDYKLYDNNVSFATINDTLDPDCDPMYVYKSYDEDKELYTVVDTYNKYIGDKLSNDDYYRLDYNGYGAHSGRLSVIDGDDYGYRFSISERHALRNVKTFAHMPHYFLEREIMYGYRVGYGTDNGLSTYDISIVSTAKEGGAFDVALNTMAEYSTTAGADSDFAYKYTASMSFTAAGAMESITFKQVEFSDTEWDFSAHAAKTGNKGTTIKSIAATYTYGNVYSGTPDFGDFNLSDYFVSELHDIQFFNTKSTDQASKDAGKSVVGLTDDIYIMDNSGEYSSLMMNKNFYSPSTALDLWQYGPTASSDTSVICKEANDVYYQMSAVAIGNADITISSHVDGVGASLVVPVQVTATSTVRDFYMTAIDTDCMAVEATIKAGGVYSFKINQFPHDSALLYTAVSGNTDVLTIASAPNSPTLTVDTTKASISVNTDVKVTIQADYQTYEYNGETKTVDPTVFTFHVLPADVDPTGKWTAVASDVMPDTYIDFTTEVYDADAGTYKGVISDTYTNDDNVTATDKFYFSYKFNNGAVQSTLYAVDINTFDGDYTASDFYLDFYYDVKDDYYCVFLAYCEYDTDEEDYYYSCILGDLGSDDATSGYGNDTARYCPFERAK